MEKTKEIKDKTEEKFFKKIFVNLPLILMLLAFFLMTVIALMMY